MTSHHAQSPCRIQNIRLWLKAFVPGDLEGAVPVPAGIHQGKTMFPSPGPIEAWFLTDQRGFSDNPDAHARMHSEIELDLMNFRLVRQLHKCDPTIQVDHKTGAEQCCETAESSDMFFSDLQFIQHAKQVITHLHGSAKNACLKLGSIAVSPNLDYELDIILSLGESAQQAVVHVKGQIEVYPAFEMYATINGGAASRIFQAPVARNQTPISLVGPPQREVDEMVTVFCERPQ